MVLEQGVKCYGKIEENKGFGRTWQLLSQLLFEFHNNPGI